MKKYGAVFALFGFCSSIAVALWGDAPIEAVLRSAILWGVTFGVIGIFLGHTASVLLSEGGIADLGDDGAGTEVTASDEGARESGASESGQPESGQVHPAAGGRDENSVEFREKTPEKRSTRPIETDEVE